jgi:hypothetical protein
MQSLLKAYSRQTESVVVISGGLGTDIDPTYPGDKEQNSPVKFHIPEV